MSGPTPARVSSDRILQTLRGGAGRKYLVFAAACVLAFGAEHLVEHVMSDGVSETSRSLFNIRGAYEYVVTAWPRSPVPRHTVLVYMDTEHDPTARGLQFNLCAQRSYIAQLVPAIAAHDPAVIVLDKFFTEDACTLQTATDDLRRAIARVAERVPVVVGLRIKEAAPGADGSESPVIANPVAFLPAKLLREGIVNIDRDSRRLAFGWHVARDPGGAAAWQNTIALEAAEAYDARLRDKYPGLARLIERNGTPFTSMIPLANFAIYDAGDFICASQPAPAAFESSCARRAPAKRDLGYLRGRIVMFGQVSPDVDWHSTVIGRVPGVVVQANYVEALLDERYFTPVPSWVDYLVGFLFFVAIEVGLRRRSAVACLGSVVGAVALLLLLVYLTARHLGYFINPVAVSAFVLLLKLIGWSSERLNAAAGGRHHARS